MRLLLLFGISILIACNKVADTPPVITPPTTVAGPDITIHLPADSILLDGSRSTGENGIALDFTWTKLDGPPGDIIVNPHAKSTIVRHLSAGTYHYKLEVCANNLCSKDTLGVTVIPVDKPPIANAGNDTTVAFGASVKLDGSKSSDAEGKITSYSWTMLDGHAPNNVVTDANMPVATTQIFEIGIFHFELKVTDSSGQISKDTVAVTVTRTEINLSWTPIATNPYPFALSMVTAAGNKLVGFITQHYESQIVLYDIASGTWELTSVVRGINMGVAVVGSKVYFMGGQTYAADTTTRIDIYDASSGQWTVDHLPLHYAGVNAYSTGNFIFIGGSARVDILNTANHSWTDQMLGWSNANMLGFDNKIFGYASGQNVLDLTNNQFTTVSFPPSFYQGVHNANSSSATSNMAFFLDHSNQEVYSLRKGDNQWNLVNLPPGSEVGQATATSHEVFFWSYSDTGFTNIFNEITNEWTVSRSPLPGHPFGSLNNDIYATNGGTVWKLNR